MSASGRRSHGGGAESFRHFALKLPPLRTGSWYVPAFTDWAQFSVAISHYTLVLPWSAPEERL
jgi:hypothetical protein